jgi:hypothetical protein
MSRTRRAFVAVVSVVILATAVGAVANGDSHHRPPVRPAGLVRSAAPVAVPSASPNADFDADTFLALLTRIDPTVANQLMGALSSTDRAALATNLETRTGLAAG